MAGYLAKLTGENDGHIHSREFGDGRAAIAWAQGDGLTAFPDQAARAEVSAPDGQIIWVGSQLQTKETAEWDERQPVRYILSKLGILDKYRKR